MKAALLALLLAQAPATDAPKIQHLPSGHVLLSPAGFAQLDAEVKRLQAAEVRLTAENTKLRSEAADAPAGFSGAAVVAAVVTGLALGAGGALLVLHPWRL